MTIDIESLRGQRCDTGKWRQRGQATAEYALVLLAAATVATLVLTWASSTNRISGLFDLVMRSISRMMS